jgi:sulfur carrier protein
MEPHTAPQVSLNGSLVSLCGASTLAELLAQQGIGPEREGIAVARNGEVVRRADWASTPVSAGDRIEVVTARQGG